MKQLLAGLLVAGLVALAPVVSAQATRTFRTRLSPVPVAAYNANVVGTGTVTATLAGAKLTIDGKYEGLASAATTAKIFKSNKPGIRGEAILDL